MRSQPVRPSLRAIVELAHELRHPVAVILLWEQIARLSDSEATRDTALTAIRQAALEQSSMIDRFMKRRRSGHA